MQRVAYFRVSTDEQEAKGTVRNQIEFAEKFAELHGFTIDKTYLDDGVTGTLPLEMRDGGFRLLEDAKAGAIDILYVYKLDRLGRSARVVINAIHELESLGVEIKSMTEPFDTSSPSGKLHVNMLASFADFERETILERMSIGANRAARDGRWLGGIVPFGYRTSEGYLEISEEPIPGHEMSEADVVRLIYSLIGEEGYSTIKVADYLNALKVPPSYTKDGRKVTKAKRKVKTAGVWRPGRVRNMVVSSTYKGIHLYGKRSKKKRDVIPRTVPAIVPEALWDAAQRQLRENMIEATRNARRKYLLRGLIECGGCGLTYVGTAYKSKAYYVCNGKDSYRGKLVGRCPSKNVPAEWLEDAVWSECEKFLREPGEALLELARTMETDKANISTLEDEKGAALAALRQSQVEKERVLSLYRRGYVSEADIEAELLIVAQERAALESRLAQISAVISSDPTARYDTASELLATLRGLLDEGVDYDTRRKIVKALVGRIIVFTTYNGEKRAGAKIDIHYNFSKVAIRTGKRGDSNLDYGLVRVLALT